MPMITQGNPKGPHLCLPPASIVLDTLNAARVGSTDDAVLRFDGTPVVVGTAIAATTTATAGTIIAITERGQYVADFIGQCSDTVNATSYGVSKNASGVVLTGQPLVSSAGMLEAATQDMSSADLALCKLSIPFFVSSAEAAVLGGALIRFHASDGAGGAPTALQLATVRCRVIRVADYLG